MLNEYIIQPNLDNRGYCEIPIKAMDDRCYGLLGEALSVLRDLRKIAGLCFPLDSDALNKAPGLMFRSNHMVSVCVNAFRADIFAYWKLYHGGGRRLPRLYVNDNNDVLIEGVFTGQDEQPNYSACFIRKDPDDKFIVDYVPDSLGINVLRFQRTIRDDDSVMWLYTRWENGDFVAGVEIVKNQNGKTIDMNELITDSVE